RGGWTSPAWSFADFHHPGNERDSRVLAFTDLSIDLPATRRWEDQVARLKPDVAVTIIRFQAQRACFRIKSMAGDPEFSADTSRPAKFHRESTVPCEKARATRLEYHRSVRPQTKRSDRQRVIAEAAFLSL